jgi:thioredoxin 1
MKNNKSLVTVLSLVVGALLLIVGIFKIVPMVIGDQSIPQDISTQEYQDPASSEDCAPEQDSATSNYGEITSLEQLNQIAAQQTPVVIKFYAPWCGACQYMNGFYNDIAQELPAVGFYSVDVGNKKVMERIEELQLIAQPIEYLPTLVYRNNGQVVDQVTGSKDKTGLIEFVKTTFKI